MLDVDFNVLRLFPGGISGPAENLSAFALPDFVIAKTSGQGSLPLH